MLQQTQVSRVIPCYERFLTRFPTVESLAHTTWEDFLPYHAGLGYYRRGRNMLKTADIITQAYGGQFPADTTLLQSLPGIGEYTANAILSFGFGQSHLAFDTNHQRVFGRFLAGDKKATLNVAEIEQALPEDTNFHLFNGALMDFANVVCTNRQPHCATCPLRSQCQYAQTDGALEAKATSTSSRFPYRSAQAVVFLHENHRTYYSSENDRYRPFVLPLGITSRHQIKAHFREKYQLELAVRPPWTKGYRDEQPLLLVNAQIVLGQPQFSEHVPADMQVVRRKYQAALEAN